MLMYKIRWVNHDDTSLYFFMFHIKLQILARSVFDVMAKFVIYLRVILFEMYVQFGGVSFYMYGCLVFK